MYFIDVQGTLIKDSDKSPIDGAIEFISTLNRLSIPYMILTNNTKKPSDKFYNFLVKSGFDIQKKSYLDPLMLIKEIVTSSKIAAYGHSEFLDTLVGMGYILDFDNPEAIVLGIKEDYSAQDYAQIIDFILSGAKLIGMHESTIYAKNTKRYPGVGSILAMLQYATGASYKVVGKPSRVFYDRALELSGSLVFGNIHMISDDVKGDLVGAKKLGMKTTFVLSGKYNSADEVLPTIDKEYQPDEVLKSIKKVQL